METRHHLNPPGWILLGQYPVGDPDGVGSWILHHGGEAALLEVPPDKRLVKDAVKVVKDLGLDVKYIMVSHDHEDHFDPEVLDLLQKKKPFRKADWIKPLSGKQEFSPLALGGEPLWLVRAPKHSRTDMVTIFRGIAMTGDIELGMVKSVNREVKAKTKRESLAFLAAFERTTGYKIHTVVSAHLNDFRSDVDWAATVSERADG